MVRFALACAGLMPAIAAATSDIRIQRASPEYVSLAPGQSGEMALTITNLGPDAAQYIPIGTWTPFSNYPAYDYVLQMVQHPGCGSLEAGGPMGFRGYHFAVGPLATGESVQCTVGVTRGTDAVNSTDFGWSLFDFSNDPNTLNNGSGFSVGTLTDVAVDVEPLRFDLDAAGVAHAIVRVRATNRGAVGIAPFSVGGCTDNYGVPFTLNGDIPNGCSVSAGFACFDYGFGFAFPGIAAHQSHSCDLALDGLAKYTAPVGYFYPESMSPGPTDASTNGSLIDTDRSNDALYLVLGGTLAAAPSLGTPARVAGIFGTLLIGLLALDSRARARRRVRTATPPLRNGNPTTTACDEQRRNN